MLKSILLTLLNSAKAFGLQEDDLKNANDLLEHNEFELCFDTVVTQMYENDIEIDEEFYVLMSQIGSKMQLPVESYSFMTELIRGKDKIPKAVKESLARIVSSLK